MPFRHDPGQPPFMVGVGVGMEKRDRQRLDPAGADIVDRLDRRRLVQFAHHLAARVHPLGMPRVSSSVARGVGLSITIQPNSGPGVQLFARCSMYSNPSVTRRPTRAPLPSSTAFVATVVPCRISDRSPGECRPRADLAHAFGHPDGLVLGRRRRLRLPGAAGGRIVQQKVGERPSDIDAKSHGAGLPDDVAAGAASGLNALSMQPSLSVQTDARGFQGNGRNGRRADAL